MSGTWADTLQIQIEGVPATEKQHILQALTLTQALQEKDLSSHRIRILHELASQEITQALNSLGYFDVQVKPSLMAQDQHWTAHYLISMGDPILIQGVHLQVQGPPPVTQASLQPCLHLKVGTRFTQAAYEQTKTEILSQALAQGFLDATFNQHEVRVNRDTHQAHIHLTLVLGKRYRFGPVRFANAPYPPEELARYLPFSEGEPYTMDQILRTQQIYTQSGLFQKVRIEPLLAEAHDGAIPIQIRLVKRLQNKYMASLGFGTDTGVRTMASWEHTFPQRLGHRLILEGGLSSRISRTSLSYLMPGKRPALDQIRYSAEWIEEKDWGDDKYSRRTDLSTAWSKTRGRTQQIWSLGYLSETYRTLPDMPKSHSQFLLPGLLLRWTKAEEQPLTHGLSLEGSVTGANQPLATTNLLQTKAKFKWIIAWNEQWRTLLRSEVGANWAGNYNKVPLSLRFFAGGEQSVRGYGYRSLGPIQTDAQGNSTVVGGRLLWINSIELERTIGHGLSVAAFVDAGNAMNTWNTPLAVGAGVGLRWASPVGPLRLDVAQALDAPGAKPRIHITVGKDL